MGGNFANGSWIVKNHADVVGATNGDIFSIAAMHVVRVLGIVLAIACHGAAVVGELFPSCIVSVDEVAFHEVSTGHTIDIWMSGGVSTSSNSTLCQMRNGCAPSAFHIVTHHVDLSTTRTAVATVTVVRNTIAKVDILCLYVVFPIVLIVELVAGVSSPFIAGTIEAGRTVCHMSNKVMVE